MGARKGKRKGTDFDIVENIKLRSLSKPIWGNLCLMRYVDT
jgi:hypothetical protein